MTIAIASENKNVMLWHNRLGHISEIGLKIISDQIYWVRIRLATWTSVNLVFLGNDTG